MFDRLASRVPPIGDRLQAALVAALFLVAPAIAWGEEVEAPQTGIETMREPQEGAIAPNQANEGARGQAEIMRRYVQLRSMVILHDQCGYLADYSGQLRRSFDRAIHDSIIELRGLLPYYDRQALNEIIHRETLAAFGDCGPEARSYFAAGFNLIRPQN